MKLPLVQKPFRYSYFDATTIIVACNAVFLFVAEFISPSIMDFLAMVPVRVKYDHAWWTFFTYMFAHGDIMHFFSNMLGLIIFGRIMERTIGSREFLLFYFLSGVLSGLLSYFYYVNRGQWYVGLIGASGVLYAIIVLFALLYPRVTVYVFGIIPCKAWLLAIVYFVIEFLSQTRADGVAHTTHLFGLLIGLLYALIRLGINPFAFLDRGPGASSGQQ